MHITLENPYNPVCAQLIEALSHELGQLYGDDGSGAFDPADVTVPRAAFVIAWEDGQALGCGALRPMHDAQTAEIKRMYVQPAARGQGISRQILHRLEALAREYNYARVCLETGIYQPAAIRLYESAGYTRMDCYGPYVGVPESICYEKIL